MRKIALPRGTALIAEQGAELKAALEAHAGAGRLAVIADRAVTKAHGKRLAPLARSAPTLELAGGEEAKSWDGLRRAVDFLAATGLGRGDMVAGIGGGTICDLAGFAAAIFKRGCRHILLPTTLLAQADAAIGGKSAINAAGTKNLVGAFHHPETVLIDPGFLDTLPRRELRAGYAEIVKIALVADAGFYRWCERHGHELIGGGGEARRHGIARSVSLKAGIVAGDERDLGGRRALLNFGHSFAHALEAESALNHGEAVAVGIVLALRLSAAKGHCPPGLGDGIAAHLADSGLPVTLAEAGSPAPDRLLSRICQDKKNAGGRLRLVLLKRPGEAFLTDDVAPPELRDFLRRQP
ncbi:MAG: 3-dehydroquinate synthase [Sphingomonadaceae bacterium]